MRYLTRLIVFAILFFVGCKKDSTQATNTNLMGAYLDKNYFVTATFAGASYTSYTIKFNNFDYINNSYYGLKMATYNISSQITYFSMFMNPNYKDFFGVVGIGDGELSIVINKLQKSGSGTGIYTPAEADSAYIGTIKNSKSNTLYHINTQDFKLIINAISGKVVNGTFSGTINLGNGTIGLKGAFNLQKDSL